MSGRVSTAPSDRGRVLIIAGSDSGGGAGIQGDIKTVTMLGGYAATAITAITVQNTLGVSAVHAVPADIVIGQIGAVLDDIGADAIKTGMIGDADLIVAIAEQLANRPAMPPLVVDPVMVAKGGASLIGTRAVSALKAELFNKARIITPNIPEAEHLTGLQIGDVPGQKRAAQVLLSLGAQAVLVKGGHLAGREIHDVLLTDEGFETFSAPRIDTPHTHGTGCALASAIACGLAQGMALVPAVTRAREYVHQAIRSAPGFGAGHGPLDHAHPLRRNTHE